MSNFDIKTLYDTKLAGNTVILDGGGQLFTSERQENAASTSLTYQILIEKRGAPTTLTVTNVVLETSDDFSFSTGVVEVVPPFLIGTFSEIIGNFDAVDGTIKTEVGFISKLKYSQLKFFYGRGAGGDAPILSVYLQVKKPVLPHKDA